MKKKNFLFTLTIKIVVIIVFSLFWFFNIFQKLDYRLYDAMFHLRKEPQCNENVMILKIDDPSIIELGEWPWSRDIMGDALLRMKELGAYNAIFDIEYISPSKNGIAPSAELKISDKINYTHDNLNELLNELSSALEAGYFSTSEITDVIQSLQDENISLNFQDLHSFIENNMSRDNDEYFAQALQFFGKSYLTINHQDLGFETSKEDLDYVINRFLIDKIDDPKYLVNIGNDKTMADSEEPIGFVPALHKLMTRAYGANFTNSVVDNDGVRRRMELLYSYNNRYLPQLSFGPFLEIVGSRDIVRQKDELIIKNAKNPMTGNIEDIVIPLDTNGRILINWRHGSCDESFKNDSIINLIRLDFMEQGIIYSLSNIEGSQLITDDGYEMEYITEARNLLDLYNEISNYKEYLLSKCTGYDSNGNVLDGISDEEYDEYFAARASFYDNIKSYLSQNYIDSVNVRLDELSGIENSEDIDLFRSHILEDFDALQIDYNTYTNYMTEMKEIYNGAYCIIGQTATSTTDNGATPFQKKFMNVGIHANILNTLLTQNFIFNIRWYYGFGLAIILSLLMLFFIKYSNTTQNIISFILYLFYCLFFAALFVFSKYYIQFIGTILFLLVDYISCVAYRFYQSVKEKRFITQIAASFANKDTVEELRKNPDAFKTEGQKKCITALFSDIQKFSTLSESIGKRYGDEGPNKLIEILNEYLGQMSNEILKNNGNIDKYEGDAIISMFGAPDPMNSHSKEEWAFRCLDSAINMKKVEVIFNQEHEDLFKPIEITNSSGNVELIKLNPLQTRIGVNSGDAFVGLMGSKTDSFSKLNYTMIGDTVNLASRLEGVNKAYNSWIMCSDSTWNMANSGVHKDEIAVRKLDRVRVVGRSTPVQLYNVIGYMKELSSSAREQLEIFNTALDKYLQKDFANAGKLFIQANSIGDGDPTSLVFAERCKNFIQNGVPENWDGVINMTSK